MESKKINACISSYGFYPMTLILKKLEKHERYEDCQVIHKGMVAYIENNEYGLKDYSKHSLTVWNEHFEKEYYDYFKSFCCKGEGYVREHIKEVLKEDLIGINNRLKLNLKIS